MRARDLRFAGWLIVTVTAGSAAAAEEPPARATPLSLDLRESHPSPVVGGFVGGRRVSILLDTGSDSHFLGVRAAREAGVPVRLREQHGLDVANRPIYAYPADQPLEIDGFGALAKDDPLLVSDFPEWGNNGYDNTPRRDALISPRHLATGNKAIVIDLVHGRMYEAPWSDAPAVFEGLSRVLAEQIPADSDGKYIVDAAIGGAPARLAIDTGAGRTTLFVPRSPDLPFEIVRQRTLATRIRAGDAEEEIVLGVIEQQEADSALAYHGLLGMDVLRSCVLMLDRGHMSARCNGTGTLGMRGLTTSQSAVTQVVERLDAGGTLHRAVDTLLRDGPALRPLANGGYAFRGHRFAGVIHRDGRVETHPLPAAESDGRMLKNDDDRDEARRFRDDTEALRDDLRRAAAAAEMDDALLWLHGHLGRMMAKGRVPLAVRKHLLFELWDQCAEPDDSERGRGGAAARGIISRFVRDRLPAGAPGSFTDEELSRLNAERTHGPRFDPYRITPPKDLVARRANP